MSLPPLGGAVARRPHFTLALVVSADGFIAPEPGVSPQLWASPEEQALFFEDVDAADWSIMGRSTAAAADRPERRRIIFSASAGGGEWRRPTQFWIDPYGLGPADLANAVAPVRPLRRGIILGGTRVHDWFHLQKAIDVVHLTVEPLHFGSGLPIFTGQSTVDPVQAFRRAGYSPVSERLLNAGGTRFVVMEPRDPMAVTRAKRLDTEQGRR